MQLHFTGGEPLARSDLEALARHARSLSLYTNLITSGVPLTRERLHALRDAGIDNVQVSFQDADEASADRIAGFAAMKSKLAVAKWVKEAGLPLTLNVVLHRANLDRTAAIIALAEELRADRLELANTQYQGWALANRAALMPTREQLDRAQAVASDAKERLRGRMDVLFVKPDYFSAFPKACMDGWARRFLHMTPSGLVLPCHAAMSLTRAGLSFESARERSLASIWADSPSFNAFRGDAWMKEPCKGCERKSQDFGGCRCQAFALVGDAAATDPVCSLSPHRALVDAAIGGAREEREASAAPVRFLYRGRPTSPST